jgi:hypothetical protein
MNRKNSRYRDTPFSRRLVRPIEKNHPDLFQLPSASGLPGVRARKVFVIKQELHVPQANAADKKVQCILILSIFARRSA